MKWKSAFTFFLLSYFGIGALFSFGFLISPVSRNQISGLLFPIFMWPFIECWGVLWVNLPWLAILVFASIITSLWLQAKYISQSFEKPEEQLNSLKNSKQKLRLRVVFGLEAFLLVSVVIVPISHAFAPLSLLMWVSNVIPIVIFGLRAARKKIKLQIT
jgi:hypothetical protein